MPDQTVQVTYDPTAIPKWTIAPKSVSMTAAGKIIFQRKPGNATWTFVSVNGLPPDWPQSGNPTGSQYTVDDPHTSVANYQYTITIRLADGTTVTSPTVFIEADGPPMIMNE